MEALDANDVASLSVESFVRPEDGVASELTEARGLCGASFEIENGFEEWFVVLLLGPKMLLPKLLDVSNGLLPFCPVSVCSLRVCLAGSVALMRTPRITRMVPCFLRQGLLLHPKM